MAQRKGSETQAMKITKDEVGRIAKLIKLKFSHDELEGFAGELSSIMEMIDRLNEIDCSNVKPLTSVCDMSEPLRKDEVTVANISDELFANVPGSAADLAKEVKCFVVPKVVE